MDLNIIHNEDCRSGLQRYPDGFFYCCVTSPPYWGLRDYGVAGQLGLEETPEEYVAGMVDVFRQVKRVLRDDGTLWLNLGDSYGPGKQLMGMPWKLALALQQDGWILRQDIIWHKPNPMPESVRDRTTKAHEYIFLLSKSSKYYYNAAAIREPPAASSLQRWAQDIDRQEGSSRVPGKSNGAMKAVGGPRRDKQRGHSIRHAGFNERWDKMTTAEQQAFGANKRSVWTISTKPFKDAHFATFPEELPHTCILAGCPDGGNVLDPFMGAGTTGMVARKLQRNYVGFELNKEYVAMAERRLRNELGMFL